MMVQGFKSDDVNFFYNERDSGVAAAAPFVAGDDDFPVAKKYESLGTSFEELLRIEAIEQENIFEKLRSLPPLNLKLRKSSNLMHQLETTLSHQRNTHTITQMNQNSGCLEMVESKSADFASQQLTEKMKASSFPAWVLRIGSWERASRHEGDLVAKCYYAKKKLVWEILERSLKRKIEIQWADILGIKATLDENQPGFLELELKQPPAFHHETDPQPRKHTNWKVTMDFTEGQASMWRRYYLKFPPGVLDRQYEKLLQCDSRLFELSQKPFPTFESPYFQPGMYGITEISLNLDGQRPQMHSSLHFSNLHLTPSSLFPDQQFFSAPQVQTYQQYLPSSFAFKDTSSPDSNVEFSHIADHVGNRYAEKPKIAAIWGQVADASARSQGQFTIASTTPPAVEYQSNNHVEAGSGHDLDYQMIIDRLDMALMPDSVFECSDQKNSLANIQPFDDPLMSQSIDGNQTNYGQNTAIFSDMDLSAHEHSNETAGQLHPQPVSWMPAQPITDITQLVSWLLPHNSQEITTSQPSNSSAYQMRNDFATFNHNNGLNRWP